MTKLFEEYWNNCLTWLIVLPVDRTVVQYASQIRYKLKMKQKTTNLADILIAATAIANNIPLITINQKHFENIDGLKFVPSK
jgi:predicted nucleic acid-binding protein